MATFKCKMCGGTLDIKDGETVVTCEFCGTKQTVPSFDSEKKATFFNRANALRLKCEFDKAAGVYETIISEYPNDAEAYWGLILCKYGIEYVDDPKTGLKIPTCHRTQFTSIFDDHDYLASIKNADAVARELYKREANVISKLQKSILEISSKEDPFDVFICYKETDKSGERTKDSVLAQDIYEELTSAGFKVFFARRTLEHKLGSAYEPYIFAALHSAKVMLQVTTSSENSDSVWVKNEWGRYLSLISSGDKKVLIPCYKGISAYDLPDDLQNLQGQDMSKIGSMQDLIYGVKKIIKPSSKTEVIQTAEVQGGSEYEYESFIRKGYTYLKNHKIEQARRSFDQAIEMTELCGDGYLGLLLCEYQLESLDELLEQTDQDILTNENFNLAREFASKSCKNTLDRIEETIRNNPKKEKYEQACSLLNGNTENIKEAIDIFSDIHDYKDAEKMIEESYYRLGSNYLELCKEINNLELLDEAEKIFSDIKKYKDSASLIEKVKKQRFKIQSDYVQQCLDSLSISLPKESTLKDLKQFVFKLQDSRSKSTSFVPMYKEIKEGFAEIDNGAKKYFVSKAIDVTNSVNTLDDCSLLRNLCSMINDSALVEPVIVAIKNREKEIKDIIKTKRKKNHKKGVIITSIVAGATAVCVAIGFGIKAGVEEGQRQEIMAKASELAKSGSYSDAKEYYKSLGDYGDAPRKVEVCNGLITLKDSISTKSDSSLLSGIRKVAGNKETVDIIYQSSSHVLKKNALIKYLASNNEYRETASDGNYNLYVPRENPGYTFVKWYTTEVSYDGNNKATVKTDSIWSTNVYKISYDLDGGTNSESNPKEYTVESDDIVLQKATKDNYTFLGWFDSNDNKIEKIQKGSYGDISLKAKFTINRYSVKFNNWDGTELYSTTITHGESATYPYENPTRPSTAQYTYTFTGWDGKLSNITKNTILTAQYSSKVNCYTVTFKNYDGSVLGTSYVEYGSPADLGFVPTKPNSKDDLFGYTFKCWDKDISSVKSDFETTAQYNTLNRYMITFVNYDGTELQKGRWNEGTIPAYSGATPTKPEDPEYFYVFENKWSPTISSVSGDKEYTAQYTPVNKKYTVKFVNYDEKTILQTTTVNYGEYAAYTGSTPTRSKTQQYTYTFSGWDKDPATTKIVSETTFIAQFNSSINKYTVSFYNYDNSLLSTSTVSYGSSATYTGSTPIKPTDTVGYKFSGNWTTTNGGTIIDNLTDVTQDRNVYAKYDVLTYKKISPTKEDGNYERTCILTDSDNFYTCGLNSNSILGFDGGWDTKDPYNIDYLVDLKKVSFGSANVVDFASTQQRTIVVTSEGKAYTAGYDTNNTMGRKVNESSPGSTAKFAEVSCTVSNVFFTKAFATMYGSFLLDNNGQLYSCAINNLRGCGNDTALADTFQPVKLNEKVIDVKLYGYSAVALTENGDIYYWGENINQIFGTKSSINTPTLLSNGTTKFKAIDISKYNVYGISLYGDLYISGWNHYGSILNLSQGGTVAYCNFSQSNLTGVKEISCGAEHVMIIKNDNYLYCQGYSTRGVMGLGENNYVSYNFDTKVPTANKTVAHVYCGFEQTFVVMADGTIYSCGYSYGYVLCNHIKAGQLVYSLTQINYCE